MLGRSALGTLYLLGNGVASYAATFALVRAETLFRPYRACHLGLLPLGEVGRGLPLRGGWEGFY